MGNIDLKFKSVELYEADNMSRLLVHSSITKEELETVFEELKYYYFIDANDIYGDNHEGATVIFEFNIPSPIFKNIGTRHYYPWNIISRSVKPIIYPIKPPKILTYENMYDIILHPEREVPQPIDVRVPCISNHFMNAFNFYLDHRKELKADDPVWCIVNNRKFYNANSN